MSAGGGDTRRPEIAAAEPMPLGTLLSNLVEVPEHLRATPVADLAVDSRAAQPGSLFIALRGSHADGHEFAAAAVARGAIAVVAEREPSPPPAAPVLLVPDTSSLLAPLAVRFFGDPSAALVILGVTGTNGKSTTTYLVRSILAAAGIRCAVLGTLGYDLDGVVMEAPNTTPDALHLQRLYAACLSRGISHIAMEVSSHALALDRVAGTRFTSAAFTNFTQDHLDFHGTMDAYFAAKARLFELTAGRGAVNLGDPRVRDLTVRHPGLITFGPAGRVTASGIRLGLKETSWTLAIDGRAHALTTCLVGEPNIQNALAAASLCVDIGIPDEAIVRGLASATAPRGRFELVPTAGDWAVAVDYAHTPDALERLLEAGRALQPRRLLVVFGCGGDRDRTKRPQMGAIAARLADEAWLTSDNPRTEEPESILDEIARGFTTEAGGAVRHRIADRAEAIGSAVSALGPGDLLLVAGKGHEDYQIIGRDKRPFDDRAVLASALKEQGK